MKAVSIQKIADSLNISRNTVSKVINGRGVVSPDTEKKVVHKALELGYSKIPAKLLDEYKNSACKSSNSKKLNIAVVATQPDFSEFWVRIINGIANELSNKNCNFLYNHITFEQEKNFNSSHVLPQYDVEGIIAINVYNKQAIQSLAGTKMPIVYYDAPKNCSNTYMNGDVVLVEGQTSICEITSHMLDRGCKKIGFIGDITYSQSIYERWLGFINAHEVKNVQIDKNYCFTESGNGHFYFSNEVEQVFSNINNLPDAFVCANDVIAYRAKMWFEKAGLNVPKDMLISGFDDIREIVAGEKTLTSVYVNNEEIGKRLVEQIIWRINNPSRLFETIKINADVLFRNSTDR